jgi:hypothetical protein
MFGSFLTTLFIANTKLLKVQREIGVILSIISQASGVAAVLNLRYELLCFGVICC